MKIKIKKLSEKAVIPKYAKPGDAGMDLAVTEAYRDREVWSKWIVKFGIAVEIPEGYVGLIFPRSSIHNTSLRLANSVGVIDSGYRGEISAVFDDVCAGDKRYCVGARAAQMIIMPFPKIEFEEVDELSTTERGTGGYGSTGR